MAKVENLFGMTIGSIGPEMISGAASGTGGPWVSITMLAPTTFTTLTVDGGVGTFTGFAIPSNVTIYGAFRAITISSGAILCQRGSYQS